MVTNAISFIRKSPYVKNFLLIIYMIVTSILVLTSEDSWWIPILIAVIYWALRYFGISTGFENNDNNEDEVWVE